MAARDARFSLRDIFAAMTLMSLFLGGGIVYGWRIDATIELFIGTCVIGLAWFQRFKHWQAAIAAGIVICLISLATWALTTDILGGLQDSNAKMQEIRDELLRQRNAPRSKP
jgi:hypothetical protein